MITSGKTVGNILVYTIQPAGLELIYCDSGNMICFSFFTTHFFPPKQKIMIPKHNGKKEFSYRKTKLILLLPLKRISWECVMFYEKSFDVLVYTLKLLGIDNNYLKTT